MLSKLSVALRLPATGLVLILLTFAAGGGCDPSSGSYRPVQATPFNFKNVKVTTNRADVGQQITLSWDFDSVAELSKQWLLIWTHSIDFPAPEEIALTKAARSYKFDFKGPVTLHLVGESKKARVNALVDVLLDETYYFRIKNALLSDTTHPAIGQPKSSKKLAELNFSNFVAVYDEDHDGRIDDLADDSYLNDLFDPKNTFLMHSTNNTETKLILADGSAVGQLDHAFGSACPVIEPGFFLTTTGIPLYGEYVYSDIFIFGVGLAYDGEDITVTDDKGLKIPGRRNVTRVDPVFACIHAVNHKTMGPIITEIDVGNVTQGLALSVYRPIMPASALTAGNWSISFTQMPEAGKPKTLSGSICDAKAGWIVTTYDGTQIMDKSSGVEVPGVTMELGNPPGQGKPCAGGIEFNVPFVVDNDIQ